MQVRGGDFFGEGTYGCTFAPPPACTSDQRDIVAHKINPKKVLGKVFRNKSSMNTEIKSIEKIAKADPKQRYFIYAHSSCTTSVKEILKDKDAAKCSYITSRVSRQPSKTFPMLNMTKGGMTLEDYIKKHKVSPRQFCIILIQILKALKILRKHGLVYHDLKFDNILYDPSTDDVKIIDFGLMIPLNDVYDLRKNNYLFSNYWLHPPEYRVFQELHKRHMTEDDVRELAATNLKLLDIKFASTDHSSLQKIITKSAWMYPCKYDDAFVKYVMHITKSKNNSAALNHLKKQASKVDIYSLGITAAYLSMYLDYASDAQQKKFMTIVQALTHPDPRKRPSATRAITMIQNTIP